MEEEKAQPLNLFNYVKKLIDLRKANPLLWEGVVTRVGTPEGLYAYELTQAGFNYSITVVHNQTVTQSRSIQITAPTLDLLTDKPWKAGETLIIPPFGYFPVVNPPRPECKLRILVHVPEDTPANAEIWMPNSTDGWQPAEILPKSHTKLKQIGPREYEITLTREGGGRLEYKFFRGGWETSETEADGNWSGNREFLFLEPEATVEATIVGWRDVDYKGL